MACLSLACSGCELAENYLDPDGPRYAANYAVENDVEAPAKLEVVTFNIKFGEQYDVAAEELGADPRLSVADVVLLQEMDAPRTDAIARHLQMNYVYYPGSVHTNGRDFGNAVLTRWPIVADKKIILPHRNPKDGRIRIAVEATIETPLGQIAAYSVHNETPWLGPRGRLEQSEAIVDDALATNLSTVAGGDFNTSDPGSVDETVALFRSAGFAWASEGIGETAGSFTLDHIFVKKLDALGAGTASTRASDHRPAWAVVEFQQQSP
ncbi:MAG TPA: endonuclease/exonuclease/phosphatase family protein [Polyangiaceae bacterium]|nr:endonuclease/exonuclease/phosphatase family protein [Polyangiaceae bacterium]